jgi:hypothetical protein
VGVRRARDCVSRREPNVAVPIVANDIGGAVGILVVVHDGGDHAGCADRADPADRGDPRNATRPRGNGTVSSSGERSYRSYGACRACRAERDV